MVHLDPIRAATYRTRSHKAGSASKASPTELFQRILEMPIFFIWFPLGTQGEQIWLAHVSRTPIGV